MSKTCCALARRLGPDRLATLNDILRTPGHRSFGKLATEFGENDKKPIERHKHRCLKVGNPERKPLAPPPEGLPKVRVSQGTNGTGDGTHSDVPTALDDTRPRAPVSPNDAKSKAERVAYVLGQMAAGTFDQDRDVLLLANAWDMAPGSAANIANEALRFRQIHRGDLSLVSEMSMSHWRRIYNDAIVAEPAFPDTKSKLLSVAASAQTGWDRAAGVLDDATKIQVNLGADPAFMTAAKKYVDTVQGVLGDPAALVERVAARLGAAVPRDIIAAVLAEADVAIGEKMNPEPPALLTTGAPS
jgi:hypothetical protein